MPYFWSLSKINKFLKNAGIDDLYGPDPVLAGEELREGSSRSRKREGEATIPPTTPIYGSEINFNTKIRRKGSLESTGKGPWADGGSKPGGVWAPEAQRPSPESRAHHLSQRWKSLCLKS